MKRHSQNIRGFTLIEMMMVILVIAVISVLAVPSMKDYIDVSRLKAATEAIAGDLQLARSESVKRNIPIYVNFKADNTTTWCYGIDENTGCDCDLTAPDNANACALSINGNNILYATTTKPSVTPNMSSDYQGVELAQVSFNGNTYTSFSPTRGTASSGTLKLTAANGRILKVIISPIGRIRICTPNSNDTRVNGYKTC